MKGFFSFLSLALLVLHANVRLCVGRDDYEDEEDRFRPDKGGPDCIDTSNSGAPCDLNPGTDLDFPEGDPSTAENGTIFSNKVIISMWIALTPNRPSVGNRFSFVFTNFMRRNPPIEEAFFHRGKRSDGRRHRRTQSAQGADRVPDDAIYEAWYYRTDSGLYKKLTNVWWWRYNVTYEFFESDSLEEIVDIDLLETFQDGMKRILQQGITSGEILQRINEAVDGPRIMGLSLSFNPSILKNSTDETNSDDIPRGDGPREYSIPIDPSQWTLQRYLALGLLLFSFFGFIISSQVAGCLLRKQKAMENWGSNLNTQEGIDSLLLTGWKVDGNKMEVFCKKNAGYNDDDSLLQGGFEKKETVDGDRTTAQNSVSTPEVLPIG